jgi:hypothetical protein
VRSAPVPGCRCAERTTGARSRSSSTPRAAADADPFRGPRALAQPQEEPLRTVIALLFAAACSGDPTDPNPAATHETDADADSDADSDADTDPVDSYTGTSPECADLRAQWQVDYQAFLDQNRDCVTFTFTAFCNGEGKCQLQELNPSG